MFSELMTDRITVTTSDGKTFTNVPASVQGDKIFTDRTDIPLRPGDRISRTTAAGVEEKFIIEDPGFRSGGEGLPDSYQMQVRAYLPQTRRPNDPVPDDPEELERDIDYWTDQLPGCSGGSERAYQIDTRLRRLSRAKERMRSAVQADVSQQMARRENERTENLAETARHQRARIERTVFINYRRAAAPWALAIFQDLTQHGYNVFFDFQGIASGAFEEVILENIKARAHFLVLLTPSALERCGDPTDLFRREIEAALASQRNIVPIMLDGFTFNAPGTEHQLGGALGALKHYNGLPIYAAYFSEAMQGLRDRYLNVPLSTVLHPVSQSAAQAARNEQAAAANAPAATETELREAERRRYLFAVKIQYQDQLERSEGTHAEEPYGPGSLVIYDGDPIVARYSNVERWSRLQRTEGPRESGEQSGETTVSLDEQERRQFVTDKLRNAGRDEIELLAYLIGNQSVSVSTIHERGWNLAVNELMVKGLVPEPAPGVLFYQINTKLAGALRHNLQTRGVL